MCRELESIGLPDPAYTHLYRKWGRLDDRLYFSMIIVNVVMAVADETGNGSGLCLTSGIRNSTP